MKREQVAKIAWAILIFNVIVIVWGVFLRASKSGDGCGKYWLTCHGEVIPSAPEFKTIIEFSHRLMSGLDILVVLGFFLFLVFYLKSRGQVRIFAVASLVFMLTEALIGAGLVLTGNVAETHTATRPLWAIGHLINTFLLLGSLTLLARSLSTGRDIRFDAGRQMLMIGGAGIALIFFVSITGSIAALTNMLFPSESVVEALSKDFAPESDLLLRIRILHPLGSVMAGVFLIFAGSWIRRSCADSNLVSRLTGTLSILVLLQLALGALTLITGAPIAMQLLHLLLADGIWIVWVLVLAEALSAPDMNATS